MGDWYTATLAVTGYRPKSGPAGSSRSPPTRGGWTSACTSSRSQRRPRHRCRSPLSMTRPRSAESSAPARRLDGTRPQRLPTAAAGPSWPTQSATPSSSARCRPAPLARIQWKPAAVAETVDRRSVASPSQVTALLGAVRRQGRRASTWKRSLAACTTPRCDCFEPIDLRVGHTVGERVVLYLGPGAPYAAPIRLREGSRRAARAGEGD